MSLAGIFLILGLFQVKHFVLDFGYQPPWMWQNKGTYGHLGGIAHAGLHAIWSLTLLVVALHGERVSLLLALAVGEFIVHYHVDWAKMNLNAKMGWKCNTHNEFWLLTGFDQLLHQATYLVMLYVAFK